jgi:hypothetical protein
MMSRRLAIVALASKGIPYGLAPAWAEEVQVLESTPAASAVIAGRSSEFLVRFDRPGAHPSAGDYEPHWRVRTMTGVDAIQGDIPFTMKDQP